MKIVIITGAKTQGKTTLLQQVADKAERNWSVEGFYCPTAQKRQYRSKKSAARYNIKMINEKSSYLWATYKNGGGYNFDFENLKTVTEKIINRLKDNRIDIFMMDDIGFLELKRHGFHNLLTIALKSNIATLILTVKKSAIEKIKDRYQLKDCRIIDLDESETVDAQKEVFKILKMDDAEKIGTYAAINGVIEVGLGSMLHSLRVPLKGHFLAIVQNFMLILYGRDLNGRGLLPITFIVSGLKAFSPTGGKIKPMLYIFLQGFFFILPTYILGFNLLSIIIGSFLLGMSTLFVSVMINYIIFGEAIITTYINGINKIVAFLHIENMPLWKVLAIIVSIKIALAIIISFIGYFVKIEPLLKKFRSKIDKIEIKDINIITRPSFKQSLIASLKDLTVKKFIIPFIVISLLILFLGDISSSEYTTIILRGIIISWFGFLMARRINFPKIVLFLEKHNMEYIAESLHKALKIVQSFQGLNKR